MSLWNALKPYPAMKDSSVPWLGGVPEHWEVVTLGRIGKFFKGNGGTKDDEVEEGIPCIRYGDLYTQYKFFIRTCRSFVSTERASDYTAIRYGDVLFAGSGETIEEIGKSAVNLLDSEACCGGDILLWRPNREVVPPFLGYASDSPQSVYQKACMGRGVTVMHIYSDRLKNLWLALPPLPEQSAITRFLNHMNRHLRRAIGAKQKLIALLNEQKQAIIHKAITRGLDPNVRLKPSGVAWLGDVPEHWEVKKLHQITDPSRPIMYGIVLPGPNVDDGVYIVKGGNCEPGKLRPEFLSRTTHEIESRYVRSRLRENDIVIAIRGGVGAAELVPGHLEGANLTQDAARIAPGSSVHPLWLLYAIHAPMFQEHVKSRVLGATVRGINIRDLKRIELVTPSASEQTEIVAFLDGAVRELERISSRAKREISLLREYRTRLIADVVTGKLDVRDAAARLPDEADESEWLDDDDALEEGDDEATEADLDDAAEEAVA